MRKNQTNIFIDDKMPYLELRYSNSCRHYKEHIHDTFSLGISLGGERIYTNKEKKYPLTNETLAIINPNVVHSCNSAKKSAYYMMYLDVDWLFSLQKSIDTKLANFKPFSKDVLKSKELYKEFKKLCELILLDAFYMQKECELINFLNRLFLFDIKKDTSTKKSSENIAPIINYLEKNFRQNISLKELGEEFGMNGFYIIRLFKKAISLTPHQYLLNLKINKSKLLLKQGEKIVNVALECGFSDQSHFHKTFLAIVATTPKEYQASFNKSILYNT